MKFLLESTGLLFIMNCLPRPFTVIKKKKEKILPILVGKEVELVKISWLEAIHQGI